jgi:Protein of unknown function (DUF3263)
MDGGVTRKSVDIDRDLVDDVVGPDDIVDDDFVAGDRVGGDRVDVDAPAGAEQPIGAAPEGEPALSARDAQVLAFERQWWRHAGAKEQAIRDTFDLSATRYYQILNGLLDDPAALRHDPMLVGRLRRLRATRTRTRSSAAPSQRTRSAEG